ncbi:matrix-remodeling-associated protein 5 [Hippoglossus stenolepis]|uniref:matrix-remodeling-associated protein 5 n=1 Tax=Hippoglossus stenolepis TaxID=195615 RepID=UPI001FAFBE2E|nr:matrix-remodeling-associated protein 5 [Hippoglossus stenolepis]
MDPAVVRVLQTMLVLMILPPVTSVSCPRPCACPQPTELHCTFRSLITIPDAVPKYVKRMNLGFNSIHKITDKSLLGLQKLELLMVHGNDIQTLHDGVFRDLVSLQMLKISYNKLKEISRHTLQGLWSLSRLHLDHNQLEFIHPDAFQGLTSLRLLQLEGNQLQQLHPATFTTFTLMSQFHVSTLRHLYLSDNRLTSLPSGLVATMPQLENLYLHGNPWACDCNMNWLHDWDKTSPGVLKCKKDKALPGGQLCPMCLSPMHLEKKELLALENLVCSSPVIRFPHRTSPPEDTETEVLTTENFMEPFGNISLGLSDQHGNEVDLECCVGMPRNITRINWEHVNQLQLASNITFSVDLECPVDREKYERLWRLIAYYSSVPAHLKRGIMLSKEPHPTYVYEQDSEKDARYYTGIKVNVMAQPAWLMQTSAELQLNRLQSSAKKVKLILSTDLSEEVEVEQLRRQQMKWVLIESTNLTRKVLSAILGSQNQMYCNVHSSGQAVVHWMLPDGSKVKAPYSSPDNRVSVSNNGRLVIKSVSHTDTGIYYCIANVHGDLAVLSFHLTVQESSNPPPGEDSSNTPTEVIAGNPLSLPCRTSASPDAEINWILPSNKIVHCQDKSSRALVYSNGTLHIPQTQLLDSGYYKCIAINQHGVDTVAAKVTVIRRNGLMRPLRRFPARPQSASGVNTYIHPEEASGEVAISQEMSPVNRQDIVRRRIPAGVAPGRRGSHPSKNIGQRPPVLRKLTEDRKHIVESKRRINVSKSKIDPEKWADILAKIRDRNTLNTVTSLPVQHTTERRQIEQTTQRQDMIEGSSDGMTVPEKERQDYLTTQNSPVQHTQMETNEQNRQSQGTHVTSNSQHTHIIHATTDSQTMQTTDNVWCTTHDTNLDQYTTSDSVFPLSQTPPVPLHVTVWQANTNSASSSTISPRDNYSTDTNVNAVETTDWTDTSERSENTNRPNVVASSNNDREHSSSGTEIISVVERNESETSQEESGKYLREATTISEKYTQAEDATLDDLHSQAMLTTSFVATTLVPTTASSSTAAQFLRLDQPNNRRRNGNRRKRPNRRKQKLNEPTQFTATTPANAPLATARTTASTLLKIEPLEVTKAKFNTTVPFTRGQAASSGGLSHKENTVSRHDIESATKPSSLPTSLPKTKDPLQPLAKPLFKSTSAAPSFPTASPAVGHGKTSSQTALRVSENASREHFDMLTLTTLQTLTGRPFPTSRLLETVGASITGDLRHVPFSNNSTVDFQTVSVQTDAKQYPPIEIDSGKMLVKESGMHFSPLPSLTASSSPLIEQASKTTSEYTSGDITTTQSLLFDGHLETEQVTKRYYDIVSQHNTPSSESEVETANIDIVNPSIASTTLTTAPSTTSSSPDPLIPSQEVLHATTPQTYSKGVNVGPKTTAQDGPMITIQQIKPIITTKPWGISDYPSATQSPDHKMTSFALKLTSGRIHKQATPTPAIPAIQTNQFREELLTNTQDVSSVHQLPGRGSISRGKPRISKSNFQTFTVKAETDAQLPCEANGEPKPFLSWTKVANGASIAQSTRVHRFEVQPNGTLIIKNTQHMDGGQYLCKVQNQYGTDKMVVNLVVLSQHPRVLQPRNRDVTVNLGGKVDLECKVEGHPMPKVIWLLPNHVRIAAASIGMALPQRVAVFGNGTLRISQASYTDKGIYKCIGSSAVGTDSVSVHLHVSALPPLIQQTQNENLTLLEGSNAYIHCTATGVPQPVIHWITSDGVQLAASQFFTGHNPSVFPNGTLYIKGLGPGNAGRYECSASNAVASSKRTVILITKKNPSSSKASISSSSPQRTDVIYGRNLLLNCVATGEPNPWIIWRTPSKKLVDSQYSFDPRIKVFPNGTIIIHSVTDKDSGDYLCMARNKIGDDYVLLRVTVLTRPAKIEQKQQRSSQEVVYGGDLKVDCVASGLPSPEISWALPDGTMVNPVKQRDHVSGGRRRRYLVFDNGTLYFNDVGMPEEGDYTCYAENQVGKDEMKVRVKLKVATPPPQILDKDQKFVRVFYGESITLRCNAKGEPMPVITWISPTNRVIASALDKYQVLDDGTLVVQKVQRFDGGNYTCMARNNVGQDHKVIRLEVLVTTPTINGLRETASAVKITAVQDQRKLVDCVAKGTPTPRVMWVLTGNVILPAPYYSNRMTVHQNGTLEIRSIKRTDSGQLACIARNEGGEVRLLVDLDVKEVVERPQSRGPETHSLSLTVGNAMTLNCSFDGSTLPHVTWILPNGIPLLSGARFSKFFHQPDGSLIISNPSVGEAGMYRCLGHNSGGLVERTITLSPGIKPEINNRYNSPISIMNGEILLLHCQTNVESVRLTWTLPSGVVLNRPQRAGRYSVLPNGTLAIQQVSVYDRGSYICRAANEYGSSQLSAAVIVITYPPQITNGPPPVTYAKHGVAVQLNCVANGIPKVELAWETPDKTRLAVSAQPRLFGNKYLHPQGSLIIQNPTKKDSGIYRCTARNAIGIDSKATFLNVY